MLENWRIDTELNLNKWDSDQNDRQVRIDRYLLANENPQDYKAVFDPSRGVPDIAANAHLPNLQITDKLASVETAVRDLQKQWKQDPTTEFDRVQLAAAVLDPQLPLSDRETLKAVLNTNVIPDHCMLGTAEAAVLDKDIKTFNDFAQYADTSMKFFAERDALRYVNQHFDELARGKDKMTEGDLESAIDDPRLDEKTRSMLETVRSVWQASGSRADIYQAFNSLGASNLPYVLQNPGKLWNQQGDFGAEFQGEMDTIKAADRKKIGS